MDMPRDVPIGNGQLLISFDHHYQIRDLYYPHVGQENHLVGSRCRLGVWSMLPGEIDRNLDRRKQRLYWAHQGWQTQLGYETDTLATQVTMSNDKLGIRLRCCDVVDFDQPILIRRLEVINLAPVARPVHVFHHHDFHLFGTKVGDTAYFDPQLKCLIHYRQKRYFMACWCDQEGQGCIDQYATGVAGFRGAEGTWRDAEDGQLGTNPIAQGSVDSTMMVKVAPGPMDSAVVYMLLGAGRRYEDLVALHGLVTSGGPQAVIDRTRSYWRLWLSAARSTSGHPADGGPPSRVSELFKRSLLVLRTQIDNGGAIIAANDSDIMHLSRDTYSYLWPRDGAFVAAALDASGFPDVTRSFFKFCSRIITDQGYFLHKYNADGSPASSWHPWIHNGRPQLPIQEDETALVVWALWRHYVRYRDLESIRPLWLDLVVKAADFMVRFTDPDTHLPLSSYDLWEERFGVHAFTVATVYGGLESARRFATCFGDERRCETYGRVAAQMREAFCRHFWSPDHGRFLRRIVPRDHERTAHLLAQVMATPAPAPGQTPKNISPLSAGGLSDLDPALDDWFEPDPVIDSSMYAMFAMDMLSPHDERVEATMAAIEDRLWVKTPVGGIARYEADHYHQVTDDVADVPGNPWFICTLWLAEWRIAKARTVAELQHALPIFEWVADHALPSGILAEQVHPQTNAPISVSPLTWSHAAMVAALEAYMVKLESMTTCTACGQSRDLRDQRRSA